MKHIFKVNLVDIPARNIYPAEVLVEDGLIARITELDEEIAGRYMCPGFVDAHVHIESSMLIPSEFARAAVIHGTVATVSDPHEIANVCGLEGVRYMLDNGASVPFRFCFGAPSCVPATVFETAGAEVDAAMVESLLSDKRIGYLTEVMNYPGVLAGDAELLKKIASAKKYNKPVDGHAPGLLGADLLSYVSAGISTDHECFTEAEALEKLNAGMKIQIREGSAARNLDALVNLLHDHSERMMFCSDDKHPDNLIEGHINKLCKRAVEKGIDVFKVLQAACVNPVDHYHLNLGLLAVGDSADFVILSDLECFDVEETWLAGKQVAAFGKSLIDRVPAPAPINNFSCLPKSADDFALYGSDSKTINVIEVEDGQLVTRHGKATMEPVEDRYESDIAADVLKIAVINRYQDAAPAIAFIRNFGLKKGALASSIAHDSHNIVVVGCDDTSISLAVNAVIEARGGISAVIDGKVELLELPVAGLMSAEPAEWVAARYASLDAQVKAAGCTLKAPYMTLSFMALLVIPELKLSDKGLFDGRHFSFIDL